uniref:Phosphorylase b kinase regulatory subunit n=1 Tax=Heterorhabditis bacteriophora TaxID=37862 RepID=A0A1I7WKC6_HETBA
MPSLLTPQSVGLYSLIPDSQFVLTDMQRFEIKKFGHHIMEKIAENSVITVWPIACVVMLQRLDIDDDATFDYRSLHSEVRDLLTLLDSLGIVIHIATGFIQYIGFMSSRGVERRTRRMVPTMRPVNKKSDNRSITIAMKRQSACNSES